MTQKPLYESAYDAAHWNWRAAGILIHYLRQNQDNTVMPSYCVLASFSIELYLKTIYYIEAKGQTAKLQGHQLEKLYNKLSQESKDAIRRQFEALITQYVPPQSSLPKDASAFIKTNAFTRDFDTTLRMISDAFVSWRYYYEKESGPVYPSAAEAIRHALNRRIIDLVPELKSH